jgi:hypothetical protein
MNKKTWYLYLDYFEMSKAEKTRFEQSNFNLQELVRNGSDMLCDLVEMSNTMAKWFDQTISLHWLPSAKNFAEVGAAYPGSNDHIVSITYELLMWMARDADAFIRYAALGLRPYESELSRLGVIVKDIGVLPHGVEPGLARYWITINTLRWIYCHEVSHSLQGHGKIRDAALGEPSGSQTVTDSFAENGSPITGFPAQIFHVTELAADDEALKILLPQAIFQKRDFHKQGLVSSPILELADIWLILSGLLSMFLMFSHSYREEFDGKVIGKHPHPAVRFKILSRKLTELLIDPINKERGGFDFSIDDIGGVIKNAFFVTLYFRDARYGEGDKESIASFAKVFFGEENEEFKQYFKSIVEVWDDLRPAIAARYRNHHNYIMKWQPWVYHICR